jgi:hypothetical protein
VAVVRRDRTRADTLTGHIGATPNGWMLKELRALVRLDTPVLEAHEHRRVVGTCPDLTEVVAWKDIPPCLPRAMLANTFMGHGSGVTNTGGATSVPHRPMNTRTRIVIKEPAAQTTWGLRGSNPEPTD